MIRKISSESHIPAKASILKKVSLSTVYWWRANAQHCFLHDTVPWHLILAHLFTCEREYWAVIHTDQHQHRTEDLIR
jgi:hypothetical protein